MSANTVEGVDQVVIFQLADESYGIDIRAVKEIILPLRITPVPGSSHLIEGIISLRGQVIPVLNLKKRFGFDQTGEKDDGRIVVTEVDGVVIGLLVDGVSEVLRIPSDAIEAPSPVVVGSEVGFIQGVAKLEGRLVITLDLKALLETADYRNLVPAAAGA